ncbi:MAG: DUF5024 domain-containing protein [Tannerellaceae bacterium]|nr:DUF5024 domain-containing protein [Tannerellaceae bacterium]
MKTKKRILSVMLVLGGMFAGQAEAQNALKAFVQKCENMDGVTVSVVQRKNETTRELEQNLVTVSFRENPALTEEIKKAFEADKKDAIRVIEEKEKGVLKNVFYTFIEGNNEISYSYDISSGGNVSMSVIERPKKQREGRQERRERVE